LVAEVFDSDLVLSQLRAVQSIVTHLEDFPRSRAEATSQRARFFGTYDYRGIKAILAEGLDFEPLPQLPLPVSGSTERPRFARSAADLDAESPIVEARPEDP
jgi:hypothetical protein